MKALSYLKLIKEQPTVKYILTDCFRENVPIVKTNKEMGFELEYIEKEYYC